MLIWFCYFYFNLSSPVPPHIVPFTAEEPVFAGESIQLTCHVSKGDTPLTINWNFHGEDLSSHQGITTMKIGQRTSLLTIPSATSSHSGEYSCNAANRAGLAVHSATVNVHGIPLSNSCPVASPYSTLHKLCSALILAFWINSIAIHRTLRSGRVGVRWGICPAKLSCIQRRSASRYQVAFSWVRKHIFASRHHDY